MVRVFWVWMVWFRVLSLGFDLLVWVCCFCWFVGLRFVVAWILRVGEFDFRFSVS